MTAQAIKVSKDVENDVLYILKGGEDTKKVSNVPISADVTMRVRHDDKNHIVGFTIHSFSHVCPEWVELKDYELMEEFDHILEVLNDRSALALTKAASQAAPA